MNKLTTIDKIIQLFNKEYNSNWIDQFNWDNEESSLSSLNNVSKKIYDFETNCFILFCRSVISGEYVLRSSIPTKLEELYNVIVSGDCAPDSNNNSKNQAQRIFLEHISTLLNVIKRYRHLISTLESKYSEIQPCYIINAYRLEGSVNGTGEYNQYYDILFDLSKYDHLLSHEKRTLTRLIIIHETLSSEHRTESKYSEKIQTILRILDNKCLLLLKKLLVEDGEEFDYLIDFEQKHFSSSNMPIKFLSKFDKSFDFYRVEKYNNESFGRNLDRLSIDKKLSIGQFTLLMKFYKDSANSSQAQIDNILSDFDHMYDSLRSCFTNRPYDIYGLHTLKNYMYNSRLSFKMKSHKYTYKDLIKDMEDIKRIQEQTRILNFYPYRKALHYLYDQMENFINSPEHAQTIVETFKSYLKSFEESIKWSKEQSFYPIQNPYRECITVVEGFGAVFIASSFCRPIKYHVLMDELNVFKSRCAFFENEITLQQEKTEIKDIKDSIDRSNIRNIELLSAFTAIITFLFGTVDFFSSAQNRGSFSELLYSTISLGLILLIFVSSISIITLRREKSFCDYFKHPRSWFSIITAIVCVVLLIYMLINKL